MDPLILILLILFSMIFFIYVVICGHAECHRGGCIEKLNFFITSGLWEKLRYAPNVTKNFSLFGHYLSFIFYLHIQCIIYLFDYSKFSACCPSSVSKKLDGIMDYCCWSLNPFTQLFYIGLITGGLLIFEFSIKKFLVDDLYFPYYHVYSFHSFFFRFFHILN